MDPSQPIPSPETQKGTIVVDPPSPSGGKDFQGVWLVTADGEKKLVSYHKRSVWAQFDRKAVTVTGASYIPQGQSVMADHFRIESLTLQKTDDTARYVRVGPKKKMHGTIQLHRR